MPTQLKNSDLRLGWEWVISSKSDLSRTVLPDPGAPEMNRQGGPHWSLYVDNTNSSTNWVTSFFSSFRPIMAVIFDARRSILALECKVLGVVGGVGKRAVDNGILEGVKTETFSMRSSEADAS